MAWDDKATWKFSMYPNSVACLKWKECADDYWAHTTENYLVFSFTHFRRGWRSTKPPSIGQCLYSTRRDFKKYLWHGCFVYAFQYQVRRPLPLKTNYSPQSRYTIKGQNPLRRRRARFLSQELAVQCYEMVGFNKKAPSERSIWLSQWEMIMVYLWYLPFARFGCPTLGPPSTVDAIIPA